MERVIRLRKFGNGDIVNGNGDGDGKPKKKSSRPLPTPTPPPARKSNYGMYTRSYYDLSNEEKKQAAANAMGVTGVSDDAVNDGSVFDLQGVKETMNLEKPPMINLGKMGSVGYAATEFNPLTGKWIIYNTPKFGYDQSTFRDMVMKNIGNADANTYEIKYGHKPKMAKGGLFTDADIAQIKELSKVFQSLYNK